jgi:hypothetical protein
VLLLLGSVAAGDGVGDFVHDVALEWELAVGAAE